MQVLMQRSIYNTDQQLRFYLLQAIRLGNAQVVNPKMDACRAWGTAAQCHGYILLSLTLKTMV